MSERGGEQCGISQELQQRRQLTEVDHLLDAMDEQGTVSSDVLEDVRVNLQTAVYELAMPLAVSTTFHKLERREAKDGRLEYRITWLGKCAVENAMKGKEFHHSAPAHARVDVEVDEARHAQEHLQAGIAQAFISPKMTAFDAPADVAKMEHLYDDDSLRVSYAVTDSKGTVIGRRLESLLVRDVPFEAWIALLKDPNNIFGKAFDIRDEHSALSVMELFRELELPEDKLPEGPVTLVAAVQKYIKDNDAYDSVGHQLAGFRKDQELYKHQAELTAKQWLDFEVELARSLKQGTATLPVKSFIASLQHNWDGEALQLLENHSLGDFEFIMTRELAAMLERAKRNVLRGKAAIATGNESVLAQLSPEDGHDLHNKIRSLDIMYLNGLMSEQEYARQQAQLDQQVASRNIRGGGGCAGDASANFRNSDNPDGPKEGGARPDNGSTDWENGVKRTWTKGICQVKSCPSPRPTMVGPCSVCKRCQAKFDAGIDPTKPNLAEALTQALLGTEKEEPVKLNAPEHDNVKEEFSPELVADIEAIYDNMPETEELDNRQERNRYPAGKLALAGAAA